MQQQNQISPQAQTIRDALLDGLSKEELNSQLDGIPLKYHKEARKSLYNDKERLEFESAIISDIHDWVSSLEAEAVIQKAKISRFHKVVEASREGNILNKSGDGNGGFEITDKVVSVSQIFLVQHDWAAVLGSAVDDSENIKLPFDVCVFEFMLSGKSLVVFAVQKEDIGPLIVPFLQTPAGWLCGDRYTNQVEGPVSIAWRQIIAICIALDAEVATSEVIRAPISLNKKRERKGKPPLKDYHIVDLSRRHRVEGPSVGTHKSPRLHFRRGHWRHMGDYKTWIKWTLVGDPNLGFIEKEYRI